jgi:hypothetical protein
MSSRLNLEVLQKEDLPSVGLVAGPLTEGLSGFASGPRLRLWDRTQLLEMTLEGKRYVVAKGEERQPRDRGRREARLANAEAARARLAAVERKTVGPRSWPARRCNV